MDELKPCPFCGKEASLIHGVVDCYSCNADVLVGEWNRRPIEDALRAEVADWHSFADVLALEVAELKAELVRYTDPLTHEQAQRACDIEAGVSGCYQAKYGQSWDAAIRKVRADG